MNPKRAQQAEDESESRDGGWQGSRGLLEFFVDVRRKTFFTTDRKGSMEGEVWRRRGRPSQLGPGQIEKEWAIPSRRGVWLGFGVWGSREDKNGSRKKGDL